jgi:putative ABC transport system permease protein
MALLSISGGFVSYTIFNGYISDTYRLIEDEIRHRMMYGDIIIEDSRLSDPTARSKAWSFLISKEEQNNINSQYSDDKLVQVMVKFLPFTGIISNKRNESIFFGLGMDIDKSKILRGKKWEWNVLAGVPLDKKEGLILGEGLAKFMSCVMNTKVKEKIVGRSFQKNDNGFVCKETLELNLSGMTIDNQINALESSIVGITNAGFKELDNRIILSSLEIAQALMNTTGVGYVAILLKDKEMANHLVNKLNNDFKKRASQLKAYHWMDHPLAGDLFHKSKEMLNVFHVFIVIVILTIVGLSVFNTFVKIVIERVKEIGTLRSIGFSKWQIYKIFFSESFLLALIGSIFGSLISLIFKFFLDIVDITYSAGIFQELVLFKVQFVIVDYLFGFIFMLILAWFATLLALRVVLKKKIVDNLIST